MTGKDTNARADRERFLCNLEDERNSAYLYRALAANEQNEKLADVYGRLAEAEEGHAQLWGEKLDALGGRVPPFRPAVRTRVLAWLAQRFGPELVIPTLTARENR